MKKQEINVPPQPPAFTMPNIYEAMRVLHDRVKELQDNQRVIYFAHGEMYILKINVFFDDIISGRILNE